MCLANQQRCPQEHELVAQSHSALSAFAQRSTTLSARPPCRSSDGGNRLKADTPETNTFFIHNLVANHYKIPLCRQGLTCTRPEALLLHTFTTMPRESSDARAALMAVYLSQRLSCHSPSPNITTAKTRLKAAERPLHRRNYPKDFETTDMRTKNLPHRRRRAADECMQPTRAISTGLGIGLGRTGRTIYGVGEENGVAIRRPRRHNVASKPGLPSGPPSRTLQAVLTPAQLGVMKAREEMARRQAEVRRTQGKKDARKKGDHTCGHMKGAGDDALMVDKGDGVGAEQVAHADKYFEMYINAEAWAGN